MDSIPPEPSLPWFYPVPLLLKFIHFVKHKEIVDLIYFLQVRRLESALEQENKQSEVDSVDGGGSSNNKRERESEDRGGDSNNGTEKIKAIEKFRDMNVKQLREQASLLGVSTAGTKRQLIDRLCNAEPDNHHSLQRSIRNFTFIYLFCTRFY